MQKNRINIDLKNPFDYSRMRNILEGTIKFGNNMRRLFWWTVKESFILSCFFSCTLNIYKNSTSRKINCIIYCKIALQSIRLLRYPVCLLRMTRWSGSPVSKTNMKDWLSVVSFDENIFHIPFHIWYNQLDAVSCDI